MLTTMILLAAGGLVVVAVNRDEPSSDRASSSGEEPEGETSPAEQELRGVVDEISAFVAQERGLEFTEPVEVEMLDDAAFEDRLLGGEQSHEGQGNVAETQVLFQALGLIDPDDDLGGQVDEALGTGVVGFYDPSSGDLVVRGTELTPAVRMTIAHELTHALDDQHFDIESTRFDDSEDEASFGFTALVEGQATLVEEAYFNSLSQAEKDQIMAEMSGGGGGAGGPPPGVPEVLIELLVAPYVEGPAFVEALEAAGGQEAVAAAYDDPPRTTEQVLDPEAYLAGEGPVEVEHPDADGEALGEMMFGQLFVEMVLRMEISDDDAETAATGWGGDWMTWWESGGQSCMRATFVGDTALDSDELRQAWSDWDESTSLAVTVDQSDSGEPVTVTSCTP